VARGSGGATIVHMAVTTPFLVLADSRDREMRCGNVAVAFALERRRVSAGTISTSPFTMPCQAITNQRDKNASSVHPSTFASAVLGTSLLVATTALLAMKGHVSTRFMRRLLPQWRN